MRQLALQSLEELTEDLEQLARGPGPTRARSHPREIRTGRPGHYQDGRGPFRVHVVEQPRDHSGIILTDVPSFEPEPFEKGLTLTPNC